MVEAFNGSETIRITAPAGTDVTMSVKGRHFGPDTGVITAEGRFRQPAGRRGICGASGGHGWRGIVAIDGAMCGLRRADGVPIVMEVKGPDWVLKKVVGVFVLTLAMRN
ncbi:MAG: hypothetical protein MZV65_17010, partial [Chromatiales bacterium]|nr:hypothetical protein [Chromatiales bacterium]